MYFLLHITDLVVGTQGFDVVPSVHEVKTRDELLRKLQNSLALIRTVATRQATNLIHGILELSQSVPHLGEPHIRQGGAFALRCWQK